MPRETQHLPEPEDTFEGEETLGAELRENASSSKEGIEDETNIYPDATVSIAPEPASVFQLKRRHDKTPPLLKLDPDFQRQAVWTPKQKSELIESILMGIPLPLIYVKEDDKGVYIIVDGRQRLTTLFQFMSHEFSLQNLGVLKDLNGAYFSSTTRNETKHPKYLTQAQQSKIEDCPLTLHVIKPPTRDQVTFDLFDRVNRGGTRLNNQEMRNAIYQGTATKLLNKLVSFESFKEATEHSIKPDRMKDRYLVLRLIGFYLWRKGQLLSVKEKGTPLVEYRSDLEDFLGKTMTFLNDPAGSVFCGEFPALFDEAMKSCIEILGQGCFRLPKKSDGLIRRPINMALFETAGYLIIELRERIRIKKLVDAENKTSEVIKNVFLNLLSDKAFIRSTEYVVDSNKSVKKRFEMVEEKIREVQDA
uniref:GmrSD restriction endonucleases N-terminal domain-containing protein n=1 Tax=Candidatus Kentrum sp. DK TaxID=2126562 RepID=A0A450S5G5_9GAMM|nr:MAG: Protein of unknown function DUF262 [Candidatus Kentron sp. DK]